MHFDGVTEQLCKTTRERLKKFLQCRSNWSKLNCRIGENRRIPKVEIHVRVRSVSFGDVRMRILNDNNGSLKIQSAKIANFEGLYLPIVHLFPPGSNGFLFSRFLSIDSCKNYVVPRGVQRNCIFWMLIRRPIRIFIILRKICTKQ